MPSVRAAALVYAALIAGVVLFQAALAAGAPWGAYAMGGASPGVFPPALRAAAVAQAVLLAGMAAVMLVRAGVLDWQLGRAAAPLAWAVAALSLVSLMLNWITPSAGERMIWGPVTLVLAACALRVAARRG